LLNGEFHEEYVPVEAVGAKQELGHVLAQAAL
jgi:hypothetical protein